MSTDKVPNNLYIICADEKSWLIESKSANQAAKTWWNANKLQLEIILELYSSELVDNTMSVGEAASDPKKYQTYKYVEDWWKNGPPKVTSVGRIALKNTFFLGEPQDYSLDDALMVINGEIIIFSKDDFD